MYLHSALVFSLLLSVGSCSQDADKYRDREELIDEYEYDKWNRMWDGVKPDDLASPKSWDHRLNELQQHPESENIQIFGPWKGDLVDRAFRDISRMQSLRRLIIYPYHYSESHEVVSSLHMSWLLSDADKLEHLDIRNLSINSQMDVAILSAAFAKCISLKEIEIDQLFIGKDEKSHNDVETLAPLMQTLANLPNLNMIHLEPWGTGGNMTKHTQESFRILKSALGLSDIVLGSYPDHMNSYDSRAGFNVLTNREWWVNEDAKKKEGGTKEL